MNVIRCSHCGTTNRAGSNFCNRCGTDLRGDEPIEQGELTPVEPEAGVLTPPDDEAATEDLPEALPDDRQPFEEATLLPPDEADERATPYDPSINLWNSADFSAYSRRTKPPVEDLPEEEPDEEPAPHGSAASSPRRLITGVQGLLEPLRIASELTDGTESLAAVEPLTLQADQLRHLRTLLTHDPVLLDVALPTSQWRMPRLHLPWLMLLFTLLLGIPILLDLPIPTGTAQQWPGVAEAYAAVDALPPDAVVLLIWAYDPATAAEMDSVALPFVSHLLARQTQPVIVSQLPGGLAVAQRLFDRAIAGLQSTGTFRLTPGRESYVMAGYLPGGAALLSLVAQDPARALLRHVPDASSLDSGLPFSTTSAMTRPALTIVVAAEAESAQQWLEQGQPVQYSPVLAFTSAGADPLLRPYLASGQLSGLVSGFDGAVAYQQLRPVRLSGSEEGWLSRLLVLQNWGHIGLLIVLVLGNLAALSRGGRHG